MKQSIAYKVEYNLDGTNNSKDIINELLKLGGLNLLDYVGIDTTSVLSLNKKDVWYGLNCNNNYIQSFKNNLPKDFKECKLHYHIVGYTLKDYNNNLANIVKVIYDDLEPNNSVDFSKPFLIINDKVIKQLKEYLNFNKFFTEVISTTQ
jgi:hypothetical protein